MRIAINLSFTDDLSTLSNCTVDRRADSWATDNLCSMYKVGTEPLGRMYVQ